MLVLVLVLVLVRLCWCVGVGVFVFVCLWCVVFDIVVIVLSMLRRCGYCVLLFTPGTRRQHNSRRVIIFFPGNLKF
jgi:hypothetical protein